MYILRPNKFWFGSPRSLQYNHQKWLTEVVEKLENNLNSVEEKTRLLKVLESAKTGTNLGEEQSVQSYFVFHGKSPEYFLLSMCSAVQGPA